MDNSLYNASMAVTIKNLYAPIDSASARIPGFNSRLDKVIDSFVSQQFTLRNGFCYQNITFILINDNTTYAPGLKSIANEIKLANDSAVNGIVSLIILINKIGVDPVAALIQENYMVNVSRVRGAAGSLTNTFKNYGGVPQNNVSFRISKPTAGYTMTGADSVNVGTILPRQSKQVSFSFQSPTTDNIGRYSTAVNASNDIYRPLNGLLYETDPTKLYSVKNGNWIEPANWSTNTVPVATSSVCVTHILNVTTDVSSKSINVFQPGKLTVNTGKRITILQ